MFFQASLELPEGSSDMLAHNCTQTSPAQPFPPEKRDFARPDVAPFLLDKTDRLHQRLGKDVKSRLRSSVALHNLLHLMPGDLGPFVVRSGGQLIT